MRRSLWIGLGILAVIAGVLFFPRFEQSVPPAAGLCDMAWDAYSAELKKARRYKDSVFAVSERSPIPPEERARFTGLRYFPIDSSWRLRGRYEPLPNALAPVIGILHLSVPVLDSCQGPAQLLVYGEKSGEAYVAFWDSTAAYGLVYEGGRYVPVEIHGAQGCIDFNRAYFPYCAYNPSYICLPYPPQNRLCLSIPAGERW